MNVPYEQDLTTARLRAALNAQAELLQPGEDGLRAIRERVAEGGRPWWRSPAAVAVAAALVLVAAIGGMAALLLLPTGPQSPQVVAGPGSNPSSDPATDQPAPDTSPPTPPSPSPVRTDPGEGQEVYVYFLAETDRVNQPRLYREQHFTDDPDPVRGAVELAVSGVAFDANYFAPWAPETDVRSVVVDGSVATVDLTSAPFDDIGRGYARQAVQQIVHTVTANAQDVKEVRILENGKTPTSTNVDLSAPVKRAAAIDVLGHIWVLEPRHDSEVTSPVQIVGYGTAFEGTVSWDVTNVETGEVVSGFTSAGANGEFADFYDEVELEPGQYKIRAYESSAEDGRPLHVDDKTFTVVD